ncbi:hypothetical protein EK21DRAFT_112713 [Setomelanomma holmii]|uniref:Uncharacterized protein n=1 Tax=Setomelanomma holmii TaxID=210430 RepID=A0A9P4LJW8_9PLEO|nr:hypothetical protein EK21DRAFT_112713 [Setomelanomma holmii]
MPHTPSKIRKWIDNIIADLTETKIDTTDIEQKDKQPDHLLEHISDKPVVEDDPRPNASISRSLHDRHLPPSPSAPSEHQIDSSSKKPQRHARKRTWTRRQRATSSQGSITSSRCETICITTQREKRRRIESLMKARAAEASPATDMAGAETAIDNIQSQRTEDPLSPLNNSAWPTLEEAAGQNKRR